MSLELIHRKERIVFTTIDVINEFGVQSVSTREIAKREGISESTIFKHFPRKNDLLIAVLEYFSKYDDDIFKSPILKKMKAREAIIYFVESYATYYENYPAITSLTQAFDVMRYEIDLADKVNSVYFNRINFLKAMVEKAQKEGTLLSTIETETLADIVIGTFNGLCLKWRLNEYNFPLKERSLYAVNLLLDAYGVHLI